MLGVRSELVTSATSLKSGASVYGQGNAGEANVIDRRIDAKEAFMVISSRVKTTTREAGNGDVGMLGFR